VALVYGANASGKSNFARAFSTMRTLVVQSVELSSESKLPVEGFALDASTVGGPTTFETIIVIGKNRYRYGFSATPDEIKHEWLLVAEGRKEIVLFDRVGQEPPSLGEVFTEGKRIVDMTRKNALFLSVSAAFNGTVAGAVQSWFRETSVSMGIISELGLRRTERMLENEGGRENVKDFICSMDTGIQGVRVDTEAREKEKEEQEETSAVTGVRRPRLSSRETIITSHKSADIRVEGEPQGVEFPLWKESAGTQRLVDLAGVVIPCLQQGGVLVVDELDARLHPLLTEAIVKLFQGKETNPKGAQLVAFTHDAGLLRNDLLRRDQVWFVNKDADGASQLYSLAEFKGVRNDASYGKEYLTGRYGAVPLIRGLERAVETHDE
jgi:uncharacterized protein